MGFAGERLSRLSGPSIPNREHRWAPKTPGCGTERLTWRHLGFMVSHTQGIDENSSLLLARAEGRQEGGDLREESEAAGRNCCNQPAGLVR